MKKIPAMKPQKHVRSYDKTSIYIHKYVPIIHKNS